MADPKDRDPAEGSRKTIENELKHKEAAGGKVPAGKSGRADEKPKRKGPTQPRST